MNTILGYTVDRWFNLNDETYLSARDQYSEFNIDHDLLTDINNYNNNHIIIDF